MKQGIVCRHCENRFKTAAIYYDICVRCCGKIVCRNKWENLTIKLVTKKRRVLSNWVNVINKFVVRRRLLKFFSNDIVDSFVMNHR